MTMSMQELPICELIRTALRAWCDVVEFNDIIGLENQFASVTATFLAFEQLGDSGRDERRLPASSGPVEPITIVGTALALHFSKALDGRVRMTREFEPVVVFRASGKDPAGAADSVPVLAVDPSPMFLRMSSSRPTLEASEEVCRAFGEGAFTRLSGVISTPPANDWIEVCNQSRLRSRSV
ncbi:MAG: hypothetical protein AAFY20_22435 [Cyanobacteria bacterium J06639_14]